MPLKRHPCQWLFDSAADANLTPAELLLPVIEFVQPFMQRETPELQRRANEPFSEFWFAYSVEDRGILHHAALLVKPSTIRCWFPTLMLNPMQPGQRQTVIHKVEPLPKIARGMTDAQFIADYEDCMERLSEPRERQIGSVRINAAGMPNGSKASHICIRGLLCSSEAVACLR